MDANFIRTLVEHGREAPLLEWKEKIDIHAAAGKAEFIKDMLSLVNAHGTERRYLLIGVRNDGHVVGVDEEIDDATLQQIVNSRVEPPIEFVTTYVPLDETVVGVIEIASSRRRFHVVSRDLQENEKKHLSKGATWIKTGSSKTPPDAWDFACLRDTVVDQALPQPIIRVSFSDGVNETRVAPSWSLPRSSPSRDPLVPAVEPFRIIEPPPGTAELSFAIHNDGDQGAEDISVFIDIPKGCTVWDPPSTLASLSFAKHPRSTSIWSDEEDNRIQMRADRLTHGLHTRTLCAYVTFPEPYVNYGLAWSGHASNMKRSTEGSLCVSVGRGDGQ